MIELDALSIADAYHWLGSGQAAAEYIKCNQSTVSRTIKRVRHLCEDLVSSNGDDLLRIEREIHQKWRFQAGRNLRVHSYQWTNYLTRQNVPKNWDINPLSVSATKNPGLKLLEERIIDAICAPYPLVANADKNIFASIELYTSFLQLFTEKEGALTREKNLSTSDIESATRLSGLNYVPVEASECSKALDEEMFADRQEELKDSSVYEYRYWGTPLTPIISSNLAPMSYKPICPYAEFLVVRKEWENHPLVLKLQESITKALRAQIANDYTGDLIKIVSLE